MKEKKNKNKNEFNVIKNINYAIILSTYSFIIYINLFFLYNEYNIRRREYDKDKCL